MGYRIAQLTSFGNIQKKKNQINDHINFASLQLLQPGQ